MLNNPAKRKKIVQQHCCFWGGCLFSVAFRKGRNVNVCLISMMCVLVIVAVSVLPAAAAIVRHPYLQLVTPTSITIVWRTDLNSADNSRVQFGMTFGALSRTATGTAVTRSDLRVKDHIVTISGLSPSTKYFYNVGTATDGVQGGGTSEHFFKTAPAVGSPTPVRVWVLGDSGDAGADQRNVRDAMLTETALRPPAPHLILHLGDIAYANGTDAQFTTNHFAVYQNVLRQTSLWPTLGNHEAPSVNTSLGIGPYYDAHVLPANGQAGGTASGTEAYYAFNYGNVHFIVLDSMDSSRAPGSPMLNWLQQDLASTGQEWVIAYWHHPPYSKGGHDSDSAADSGGRMIDMRERVLPILEAGGVDLILAGHSHAYERSYLLNGVYGYGTAPTYATPTFNTLLADGHILDTGDGNPSGSGAYQKRSGGASHDGTVYVVAGHGGHGLSNKATGNHPVMKVYDLAFGSVLLDINGNSLTLRNLRAGGAITDTMVLVKTHSGVSLGATNRHDVNGDEKADLVWRNTGSGAVAMWLMDGTTVAATGFPGSVPLEWQIAEVGDVNGDGMGDLLWRNMNSGMVAVWLMNGTTVSSTGFPAGVPLMWQIAVVGDMDGNGTADLVWRNTGSGAVALWFMNGPNIVSTGFPPGASLDWKIQAVGDVNGDGLGDLVWRHANSGWVAVWLMNGARISSTGMVAGIASTWEIAGMADMDGNKKSDLVWRNRNSGAVAIWLMNGSTIASTGFPASVSLDWDIEQVSDLNGDGRGDLIWRNTNTGAVGIWMMNGATITSAGFPGGAPMIWQIQ
jgi:hypothetical protein